MSTITYDKRADLAGPGIGDYNDHAGTVPGRSQRDGVAENPESNLREEECLRAGVAALLARLLLFVEGWPHSPSSL